MEVAKRTAGHTRLDIRSQTRMVKLTFFRVEGPSMQPYRHILVQRQGDCHCVRLRHTRLEENEIFQLGEELLALVHQGGCRHLALSLGPEPPDCLYSVFLAKLVMVRNALRKAEGKLVLCEVAPVSFSVFEACMLHREFTFLANFDAAMTWFAEHA